MAEIRLWRVVAGMLQAALGVVVAAWWRTRHPSLAAGPGVDTAGGFVVGAADFFYFLVARPVGWLSLWLFGEGLARVLAAGMGVPLGTAPVGLARLVAAHACRPPRLPDDVVTRADDAVIIDSARDYGWDALSTVDVGGALFAVARQPGAPLRPFRYRLTPIGDAHVVRTVARYPVTGS